MEDYVSWLKKIGMQEYQAKAFVALLSRSEASAQEISELSGIPITKIYAVLQSLENIGFLKSTLERPKRYRPIDIRSAINLVLQKKKDRIEELEREKANMINDLEEIYEHGQEYETPASHVWMVNGEEAVIAETVKMIGSIRKEFNVILTFDDTKLFFASDIFLFALHKAMETQNIKGKWIVPDTFLKLIKETGYTKRRKIKNVIKEIFKNKNIEYRILPTKKIHVSLTSEDEKTGCIVFRHPLQKNSISKLIIQDVGTSRMLKENFLSLWETAEKNRK